MEINPTVARLKAYAAAHKVPIIEDESLYELMRLIAERKPTNILEIGTAIGYSGSLMLSASPNARLTTFEIDSERFGMAAEAFAEQGLSNRVTAHLDDAVTAVEYLEGGFDFILLDGPKGHYGAMLPSLKRVLTSGGVLFADNVLFKGKVEEAEYPAHKHRTIIRSLREFSDNLSNDKNYIFTLKRIGDGIITAEKIR